MSDRAALRNALKHLERGPKRARRSGRFTTAPLVLGLALALGDVLLVVLIPRLWESVLPGGLEQAAGFEGGAGTVRALAAALIGRQAYVAPVLLALTAAAWLLATASAWARALCRVAAFAAIVFDGWALATALSAGLTATAGAAGIDLGLPR